MDYSGPVKMLFAQIAVVDVPKILTYRLDARLEGSIGVGSLVRIPLGKRSAHGVVLGLSESSPYGLERTKSIYDAIYPYPILTPELIDLCHWMAHYYATGIGNVIETVVPSVIRQGVNPKVERTFIKTPPSGPLPKLGPTQKKLWAALENFPASSPITFDQIKQLGISPSIAHALVTKGLLRLNEQTVYRGAYADDLSDAELANVIPPKMTDEQQAAIDHYLGLLDKKEFTAQLLHGVTGSGKTEVYLHLIQHVLNRGGSAIMLVPEVALTPQMVGRIRARFGNDNQKCVVWHSHLSAGERSDAYRSMVSGTTRVVVGARSALFAPLKDLQLIILDEEHENAYKQEVAPRYHARDVAFKRATLTNSLCLYGSATPSLECMHKVRQDQIGLVQLTKRIIDRPMPYMHVVDLRRAMGKTPWISPPLRDKIFDRLEKGEQILLFLNRRGHSTSLLCPKCGHTEECHQCSISMTYHAVEDELRCHLCGHSKPAPQSCPGCGGDQIKWRGVGTQKVEQILKQFYPKARVARVDADALSKKNNLRSIFADFRRGKLDILIGTQMIAKGLDFPNVTLVGLIDADLSLHQPDFRAAERTFQLLVQVAGRAGRGDQSGEVVVQTFLPHSSTLQYARHTDYDGFLEEELTNRKEYGYPPYRHLIQHLFRSRNPEKLDFYCEAWAKEVTKKFPSIEVRGPSPAPIERIEGLYRYQVWYLCRDIESVIGELRELKEKFPFDSEITDVLDIDATHLA